jgi:hypothetical protein
LSASHFASHLHRKTKTIFSPKKREKIKIVKKISHPIDERGLSKKDKKRNSEEKKTEILGFTLYSTPPHPRASRALPLLKKRGSVPPRKHVTQRTRLYDVCLRSLSPRGGGASARVERGTATTR